MMSFRLAPASSSCWLMVGFHLQPARRHLRRETLKKFLRAFAADASHQADDPFEGGSSRGFVTNFRYAAASLMCACSKKRMPLVW